MGFWDALTQAALGTTNVVARAQRHPLGGRLEALGPDGDLVVARRMDVRRWRPGELAAALVDELERRPTWVGAHPDHAGVQDPLPDLAGSELRLFSVGDTTVRGTIEEYLGMGARSSVRVGRSVS